MSVQIRSVPLEVDSHFSIIASDADPELAMVDPTGWKYSSVRYPGILSGNGEQHKEQYPSHPSQAPLLWFAILAGRGVKITSSSPCLLSTSLKKLRGHGSSAATMHSKSSSE